MKRFFTTYKKQLLTGLAAVLILGASIGGTAAWLTAKPSGLTNTFTAPSPGVRVEETPVKDAKTNVHFTNTGDVAMYFRATVVGNWMKGGQVVPAPESGYKITFSPNPWPASDSGWFEHKGYYYYSSPVAPGSSTKHLIDKWTVTITDPEIITAGYTYDLHIVAQAIQADGVDDTGTPAVKTKWPDVKVLDDGTLAKA